MRVPGCFAFALARERRQCAAAATIDRRRDWLRGAAGPQDGALAPRPPPLSLTLRPAAAFVRLAWVSTRSLLREEKQGQTACRMTHRCVYGAAESLHGGAPRRQGHRRMQSRFCFFSLFSPTFPISGRFSGCQSVVDGGWGANRGLLTRHYIDFLHFGVILCAIWEYFDGPRKYFCSCLEMFLCLMRSCSRNCHPGHKNVFDTRAIRLCDSQFA